MNNFKQTFAATAIFAVAVFAGVSGCSDHPSQLLAKPELLTGVTTVAAHQSTVPDYLEAVGTVRASQTAQIASQILGTVTEIRAHEGDRVQPGQLLATIDDAQLRASVQQSTAATVAAQRELEAADSDFALADSTLKRYQQLFDKKSVSPQEFDEVKARRASFEARREMARATQAEADAALSRARTALGYTRIHTPFAGVVTEKSADVGTMASPGSVLFTVEDTRKYRLEATVDERDIAFVHLGQPAFIELDAFADVQFKGTISQIVPAADPASRAFLVKIDLPADSRLRSGLFGRARIARGQRSALFIPQNALVERGQLQGVYLVDANCDVRLTYITVGKTADQQVEVLSGLREGDKLIAAPGDRDWNGKQVALPQ